jgi:hypothetical protein
MFTRLIGTAAISTGAMGGILFGAVLDAPPVAAPSTVVDHTTPIPLGVAVGVASAVVSMAWWLAGRLTKIDDQLDSLSGQLKDLPCHKQFPKRKAPDCEK